MALKKRGANHTRVLLVFQEISSRTYYALEQILKMGTKIMVVNKINFLILGWI